MQVNTKNIQRPSLFSDFFNLELIWNNEYLTYIQTSVNAVTSNLCKIAKTTINNNRRLLRLTLKTTRSFHRSLKISLSSHVPRLNEVRNMFKKARLDIPRSRNDMSSLM